MAVKASRKFKTEQKYARAGFYRTTNQSIHCNSKRLGIIKDVAGRDEGADDRSKKHLQPIFLINLFLQGNLTTHQYESLMLLYAF
ncbi:hypothetical protein ACFVGI_001146 [Serratia marcescens]